MMVGKSGILRSITLLATAGLIVGCASSTPPAQQPSPLQSVGLMNPVRFPTSTAPYWAECINEVRTFDPNSPRFRITPETIQLMIDETGEMVRLMPSGAYLKATFNAKEIVYGSRRVGEEQSRPGSNPSVAGIERITGKYTRFVIDVPKPGNNQLTSGSCRPIPPPTGSN